MPFSNAISWTSRGMVRRSTGRPLTSAIHTSGFRSIMLGNVHFGSNWRVPSASEHFVARIGPGGAEGLVGVGERPLPSPPDLCRAVQGQRRAPPPHPRQRHRVTNWAAYDAALRQRGSLTVWFTD